MPTFAELEELRKKRRSTVTPFQAGANANKEAQQRHVNPLDLGTHTQAVGDAGQGMLGAAKFGIDRFGDAFNQIGSAVGGAVSGAGDFLNEQGKRVQALGDIAQGKGEDAYKKLSDAEKDKVTSQTKLAGAAGNVAGAVGSALFGAGSLVASPVVGGAYATGRYAGDVLNAVAPEQAAAFQKSAGDAAVGAAGMFGNVADTVRGVAKANYANMRNPLTGENIGFDEQQAQELGDAALVATQALPVPTGLVAGKVGSVLTKYGDDALKAISGRMTKEAADIIGTQKSIGGNWLNSFADQLKQGATSIAMKVNGVELPKNMSMKEVTDTYFKNRANAFYGTNLGKVAKAVSPITSRIAPAAKTVAGAAFDLSPLGYGSRLTKAAFNAEMKVGKALLGRAASQTIEQFLGKEAVDAINESLTPKPELVQKFGMLPKDQTAAMTRNAQMSAAGLFKQTDQIAESVGSLFEGMKKKVAGGSSLRTVADAAKQNADIVVGAADEVVTAGLGTTSAFYENTRQVFESIINDIGANPLPNSFKAKLGDAATYLGKNQTVESLQKTVNQMRDYLMGNGITPKELAQNKQTIARIYNAAIHDLSTTLGSMNPALKNMFKESGSMVEDLSSQVVASVKSAVDKAPTDAAKRAAFQKNVIKELSGLTEETLAPVADRLAAYVDTFIEDGATTLHEWFKGTPLEKLSEWKTLKALMPDETQDMLDVADIYKAREKGPAMGWAADAFNYVRSKMTEEDTLAARLLATKADDDFESYALKENLQPQQVKSLISGDKGTLDLKIGMLENAEKSIGRSAAKYIPSDLMGAEFAGEYSTLKALQKTVGTDYAAELKAFGSQKVDVTDASNNLVRRLVEELDLEFDEAGKLTPGEKSNLNVLATDRNKVKGILETIEKRIGIDNDGLQAMTVADLDQLDKLFDEIPGQFELSETGAMRKQIENIFGEFRKDVQSALPERLRDLQAYYAKVMDSQRAFYKLSGMNEKNFNQRTIWNPDPDAGDLPRNLTETAARQIGQNMKKLTGASRAEYHDLIEQVYAMTRESKDVDPLMQRVYSLLETNRFIRETVGEPISTMAGNEGTFRGASDVTDSKWGGVASTFKNQGPARAVAGVVLMETPPQEKFEAVLNLLRNQRALVERYGSKAMYSMDDPFGAGYLGMQNSADAARRYATPEDTAMANSYDSDVGNKHMELDEASQTLPDTPANNLRFQEGTNIDETRPQDIE